MKQQHYDREINHHYGRGDLEMTLLGALQAAGKNLEQLKPDDLVLVDHFHIAGKQATRELMQLAALQKGMEVLDVGGGLGGPARMIAAEIGCQVTVLDLTEEYCRVGEMLTARTGLSDQVCFQQGNGLDMPFPDAHFDVVWTQHSSMNIADKAQLYMEIQRILRPGGRFVFHEIMAGPVQPIHFPVPWAPDPAISFLRPSEEIRTLLIGSGLKEVSWIDTTARSLTWFQQGSASQGSGLPMLGLHLLLGQEFKEIFGNVVRNLQEQRIVVVQAVFCKSQH